MGPNTLLGTLKMSLDYFSQSFPNFTVHPLAPDTKYYGLVYTANHRGRSEAMEIEWRTIKETEHLPLMPARESK